MADSKKQSMVTAVFRNRFDADQAFEELYRMGYTDREINVLMSENTKASWYSDKEPGKHSKGTMATEGMGVGGAIGTGVGAAVAAIAAIGTSVAIPGLGMVIAGPLAAALVGAGAGAVTGGLVGALVGWGIPESNAKAYEQALKDGGIALGVVPRTNEDAGTIRKKFEDLHGDNIVTCNC